MKHVTFCLAKAVLKPKCTTCWCGPLYYAFFFAMYKDMYKNYWHLLGVISIYFFLNATTFYFNGILSHAKISAHEAVY